MGKQILRSSKLNPPIGVFSQATMAMLPGRIIWVSGLTARDASGAVVGVGDVRAQTRQILENLKAILAEGGATLDDVVKVTVFVRNMDDFQAIHEVRREYFPKDPPASTMVEVSRLVEDSLLIEIEATAVVNS
ncbi:MAG TPA: RidA family protein [Gemmatimonadaceae bacterium]|nr:RidA family protein [Gemmatimonadaceae bacterium]